MTTSSSRYSIIIDNRNYDYPNCGGRAVLSNGTHYIVEIDSNYQGSLTGYRLQLPLSAVGQPEYLMEMDMDELDALRECVGGKTLRRGYRVQ